MISLKINPLLDTDVYKIGHPFQYPENLTNLWSNTTARKSRIPGVNFVVNFGLQVFIKEVLIQQFNENFFNKPKQEVLDEYHEVVKSSIGELPSLQHISDLHDLQYLPIEIRALPEGSIVPIGVPLDVFTSTHPKFAWLASYLETKRQNYTWRMSTAATISYIFKQRFVAAAKTTGYDLGFTNFQGHNFSMRGCSGSDDAIFVDLGHCLNFLGSDTVPGILAARKFYNAGTFVSGSVPATEHTVAQSSIIYEAHKQGVTELSRDTLIKFEIDYLRRLLVDLYPDRVFSYVADTYDFWHLVDVVIPELKDEIAKRTLPLVLRPDSGNPADILCGDPTAPVGSSEYKGLMETLIDLFGYTTTKQDYKLLNPCISAIYGDSITLETQQDIINRLIAKKICPTMVLGMGSFLYVYNTRDTFGFAQKATANRFGSDLVASFKDPKTGDGMKTSRKGLLLVDDLYNVTENVSLEEFESDANNLKLIFKNGKLLVDYNFEDLRAEMNQKTGM